MNSRQVKQMLKQVTDGYWMCIISICDEVLLLQAKRCECKGMILMWCGFEGVASIKACDYED